MGIVSRIKSFASYKTVLYHRDFHRVNSRMTLVRLFFFLATLILEWVLWYTFSADIKEAYGLYRVFLLGLTVLLPFRIVLSYRPRPFFRKVQESLLFFSSLDYAGWIFLGLLGPPNALRFVFLYLVSFPYLLTTLFPLNSGYTLASLLTEMVGFILILWASLARGWLPVGIVWLVFYIILAGVMAIHGGLIVYLTKVGQVRYRKIQGYHGMLRRQRDWLQNRQDITRSLYARVSHELRTPLNGIMGMTNLLQDSALPPDLFEYTLGIRSNAELLLSIINDILDKSKIDSGFFVAEKRQFSLGDTLNILGLTIRHTLGEKPVRLDIMTDPQVPDIVQGDQTRLMQILFNILGNAAKFTKEGTITLDVGMEARQDHRFSLSFRVTDTGIGIPQDQISRIFDEYVQLHSVQGLGGSGLGLSITRDIVRALDGTIHVQSTLGKGTTFRVTLPFEVPGSLGERVGGMVQPSLFPGIKPEPVCLKVLVVDDNGVNRQILQRMLEKAGCFVHPLASGGSALESMTLDRYDLVFLDYQMADMNGVDVIRELDRKIAGSSPWSGTRIENIILITGHGADILTQDISHRIHSFLQKPVRLTQIMQLCNPRGVSESD